MTRRRGRIVTKQPGEIPVEPGALQWRERRVGRQDRRDEAHAEVSEAPSPPSGAERAGVRWGIPERLPTPTSPSHCCAMGHSLSALKGGEGLVERLDEAVVFRLAAGTHRACRGGAAITRGGAGRGIAARLAAAPRR